LEKTNHLLKSLRQKGFFKKNLLARIIGLEKQSIFLPKRNERKIEIDILFFQYYIQYWSATFALNIYKGV